MKTPLLAAAVIAGLALALAPIAYAETPDSLVSKYKVPDKVPAKVRPFALPDVKLLDGPFKKAMQIDEKVLLDLEPDRFLSRFREYAGLTPKSAIYGGWESGSLSGHALGHYLSACALMYSSTGDKRYLERVNYIVDELADCQKANGNGYISATPRGKEMYAEVASGNIRSAGFDLNGVWSPWYTMHKIFAGLRDAYLYCDNQKAKTTLVGLSDWAYNTTKDLNDAQMQKMLDCEIGGMPEVLSDVYAITGNQKYLTLAHRFDHKVIMDPLRNREDKLTGRHGNTQIPKAIGAVRDYELTADQKQQIAAHFFWHVVTEERSFVIGGNTTGEYFSAKEELSKALGTNTCETCNTYNMLKLTKQLFTLEPKAEYADYYERALYNHILASQNPENGRVTYFVPLQTGSQRSYCQGFECCVGTGYENHAKYAESIYFHNADTLYVNLFIASQLNWKAKGVQVTQQTAFPEKPSTRLSITAKKPTTLTVCIRHPYWAVKGITVSVNGKKMPTASKPSSYVQIARKWKTGDVIDVSMPMTVRTEGFKDNPRRLAFMYGPVVMCAEVKPQQASPVLVSSNASVAAAVKPVAGAPLKLTIPASVVRSLEGESQSQTLVPFYQVYDKPYEVYWDTFTPAQWADEQKAYEAELAKAKELAARTVDEMRFEMQPERDHNLQEMNSRTGEMPVGVRMLTWRTAFGDGWFSFDMKVDKEKPMDLACTFWSGDTRRREFDIQIDGKTLKSVQLTGSQPAKLYDEIYPIPEEMTKGKDKITVKFLPSSQMQSVGRLFGCKTVLRK